MDYGNNYSSGGGYGQNQYNDRNNNQGGYGQTGGYNQGGYGGQQQERYGGQQGGYDSQQGGYGGSQGGYGSRRDDYRNDVEMQNNPQTQSTYNNNGPATNAGDRILDDCTEIDQAISDLEGRHNAFKALTSRILSDRAQLGELEASSAEIMSAYRNVAARMKKIKSNPESGSPRNVNQVGRVDRRLKSSMTEFQKIESGFRAQMKEQQTRQYRIVNPEATDDEIRQAVEDPNTQVFQQALMNADRRGQSQTTLNAVRQRHAAIQNIEKTMMELGALFQDLDTLVVQQDVQVKQIEEKATEIQDNVFKGNEELDHGIASARAARKKKWICLGIAVVLLIAIIIAIIVAVLVVRGQTKAVTGQ